MRVSVKRGVFAALAVLVAIQFLRPSRTNPLIDARRDITAAVEVPPTVAKIFSRACDDCHSNRTVWPWYTNVAPVSWLIAHDVNEGRAEMNFSDWSAYNAEKLGKLRKEMCDEVSEEEMPGSIYTLMHPQAKLTDSDVQDVCRWVQAGS